MKKSHEIGVPSRKDTLPITSWHPTFRQVTSTSVICHSGGMRLFSNCQLSKFIQFIIYKHLYKGVLYRSLSSRATSICQKNAPLNMPPLSASVDPCGVGGGDLLFCQTKASPPHHRHHHHGFFPPLSKPFISFLKPENMNYGHGGVVHNSGNASQATFSSHRKKTKLSKTLNLKFDKIFDNLIDFACISGCGL